MVEILIVIAILGLVLAIAAPQILPTYRREPLRRAANDVVEGLRAARAKAILEAAPVEFVLYGGADGRMTVNRIVVPHENTAADRTGDAQGSEEESKPIEASAPGFEARLDGEVAVTLVEVNFKDQMKEEQARVRFFPNGTSDDFTVVLESRAGVRKISLDAVTGLADLEVLR
jgi:Tfp pilus assembly protein FimT